ncbi:MAG: hypothetical protein DME26_19755 [Verrucomicrobia bacterium]|nr:MAG: hypothetical protein DME26_19755 [Verrucomicrobiota bacterium]
MTGAKFVSGQSSVVSCKSHGPPTTDHGQTAHIHYHITADQICVLTFDRPGSTANIFDRATLSELNEHLDRIANGPRLSGLVLTSGKPSIFIAGADLRGLADWLKHPAQSVSDLHSFIELGQSVFNRLASLMIPTVAAIHGACLGGGFEVCLACDYRLASPDRTTKIGLPETQLGILPAWGGSTRLPRLIGLPKALEVILAGKTLAPRQALRRGMVDDLIPREHLLKAASHLVHQGKPHRSTHPFVNNRLVASAISIWLRRKLLVKTRGHYPAPLKALETATKGITRPLAESLAVEREALVELARTEACRNLVQVFFLQERAKKLSGDALARLQPAGKSPGHQPSSAEISRDHPVKRVAVVGAGVMGAGIAQWLSARQLPVILRDINVEQVAHGMANIACRYHEGLKHHIFTQLEVRQGLDRIYPAAREVPLAKVDLVIEAAVEKIAVKKEIFRRLDELSSPGAILATNTSALSITEIAGSTKKPARVIGLHFFNPVHRMQLVEVVLGRETDPAIAQRAVRFVQQLGKLPLLVKDSPGFLVNRILLPYLMEAGYLFEAGASVEDIDAAMLDFGMPMGPLRLIDEVGVDVAQHVAETLAAYFTDRMRTPRLLSAMLEAGLLGSKSGRGFYLHDGPKNSVRWNPETHRFRRADSASGLDREKLQRRMVLLMVNEAARCLEEQIIAGPADVDFGMIMGTGFAPFRGGPLRFSDSAGADKLVEEMSRLVAAGAPQFEPCGLLKNMAAEKGRFYEEGRGLSVKPDA